MLDNSLVTDALPLMTVNTIAATGSEYDNGAVISNIETNEKLPLVSDQLWPVLSPSLIRPIRLRFPLARPLRAHATP